VTDDGPKREDYPDTPEGLHMWAQARERWNSLAGIKSADLIKQWNEGRKQS
jgi:hypothetical protein